MHVINHTTTVTTTTASSYAGWTGGSYGVGSRISLKFTRAIIDAIHSGALDSVECVSMPLFNLQVCTCVSACVDVCGWVYMCYIYCGL